MNYFRFETKVAKISRYTISFSGKWAERNYSKKLKIPKKNTKNHIDLNE